MNNITQLNSQRPAPVTPTPVTPNWNGQACETYELPVYDGPVGATIVDELSELLGQFAVTTENDNTLMTLWTLQANVFDWFPITPRLGFTAGVHECGKSQAMEACQLAVNNSIWLSDVTPASFFTFTQHGDKALFIDEMGDCLGKGEASLRSALKTGMKHNGSVSRVEMGPTGRRVMQFRTYAAVAFGGVSVREKIDIENRSRTHWVLMRRAVLGEDPETLDQRIHGPLFRELGGKCRKWLQDNEQAIRGFDKSKMAKHLIGRKRDKWLPLYAIANVAGQKWMDKVHQCVMAELDESNEMTDNLQVLKAIWDIYFNWGRYSSEPRDTKVVTSELCRLLAKWVDEDGRKPYARWNKGIDPEDLIIRARQLAGLIGSFTNAKGERLHTDGHRSQIDGSRERGYLWADLIDTCDRHLPESEKPSHTSTCDKEVA